MLLPQAITNHGVNTVVCRTETSQLHPLPVFDFFGIRISPFDGDVTVSVGIHQHIECTVPAQLRQESNRGSDLSEYSSDFSLDLSFGLVGGGSRGAGSGVFLTGGGRLRFRLGRLLVLDVDVELPAFDVLAGVFVGDDDDEARNFATNHPFVELGHDFLDVGFYLVVGGDCERGLAVEGRVLGDVDGLWCTEHVEAIFLDAGTVSQWYQWCVVEYARSKVFGWVYASLEEDCVDGVLELSC